MIEEKGLGGKKVVRVNVSLTNKQSFKLNRLATACSMKPTTLAGILIEKGLNNADLVAALQKVYCTYTAYKITPIVDYEKEELIYKLYDQNRRDDF